MVCLGPYGGPRGKGVVSYERGSLVGPVYVMSVEVGFSCDARQAQLSLLQEADSYSGG